MPRRGSLVASVAHEPYVYRAAESETPPHAAAGGAPGMVRRTRSEGDGECNAFFGVARGWNTGRTARPQPAPAGVVLDCGTDRRASAQSLNRRIPVPVPCGRSRVPSAHRSGGGRDGAVWRRWVWLHPRQDFAVIRVIIGCMHAYACLRWACTCALMAMGGRGQHLPATCFMCLHVLHFGTQLHCMARWR